MGERTILLASQITKDFKVFDLTLICFASGLAGLQITL